MNYMKSSKISEELQNRIISVAYGNASFLEKRRIEKLASQNEEINKLLVEYRNTANAVKTIKKEEYSGELKIKTIEPSRTILEDIYLVLIGKPAVLVISTALIIFAITFSLFNNQELTYEGFSIAEVQKASIETKQALQIVNNIFSKTEDKIKYDILTKEVSKPINAGMSTVNKLFKKEKKNEI